MGRYVRGDVILAPIPFKGRGEAKTRPAVVVASGDDGSLFVCPVSSKISPDKRCIPLGIDDFATGGLDLFKESFVLAGKTQIIRTNSVIGLKGRLTSEVLETIESELRTSKTQVPDAKKSRHRFSSLK